MKKVLQWSSISTKLATTSHLKPFITKTKEEQDIWHWKSKSQPRTGTKLWQGQTGKWDTNPPAIDNQIFNDNTDSLPLKKTTQHLTNKQHRHRSCTLYVVFSIFHFKSFSNSYFLQHNIKFVRLGKTSKIHGQIQKYSADVLTQNIQSVGEIRQFYSQQVSVNTEHTVSGRTKTVLQPTGQC